MRLLLLASLAVVTLSACDTDGQTVQTTANGYEYIMRHDAPGEPIGVGGAGSYYLSIYQNDSLLQDLRTNDAEPQRFILPSQAEMAEMTEPNPLIDVLQLMSEGDSLSVLIKLDTIERRPEGFDATDVLRYDVVLTEVIDRDEYQREEDERRAKFEARMSAYKARELAVADTISTVLGEYKQGAARAGFTQTPSGLKYKILSPGTGPQPAPGNPVLVSYYGVTTRDGSMFDNSFANQRPIDFPLGQGRVIPGWDEGIALLNAGARAVFAIPADLAYGDTPPPGSNIQPGDELMFYVHLEEIAQ